MKRREGRVREPSHIDMHRYIPLDKVIQVRVKGKGVIPRVKGCAQSHVESASAAKSREITRRRARSTPRPPIRAITEATFSSELLLVANQTLAAYSLVDEGSIARKSEASPCVVHSKAKC